MIDYSEFNAWWDNAGRPGNYHDCLQAWLAGVASERKANARVTGVVPDRNGREGMCQAFEKTHALRDLLR